MHVLSDADQPLARAYDLAMLDLDGVVYRGDVVIDGVAEQLTAAVDAGMRLSFVTNNASRTPAQVVAKLRGMDVPAADDDVVTSAQAAARLVNDAVPKGSNVLVIGGEGLSDALAEYGLVAVDSASQGPAAVVQGFATDLGWAELAEGAYAVATGIPWIASNTDLTIPTDRGVAPGNGTLVAAIAATTTRRPVVAGKPRPPLFDETVLRVGGTRPLVVGDRLDTDIEGANAVGADSLLVLTGVSTLADVAAADPVRRPTYVATGLDALADTQRPIHVDGDRATCAGSVVRCADDGAISAETDSDAVVVGPASTDLVRATVALAWARTDAGRQVDVGAIETLIVGTVR